ncbi:hypothetical protein K449DRAFT_398967 [Hypoxylon sp. EC38]|nr:hypothetical protein K449DRAFT_398967 [Hypoxylon sp. EC38]
MDVDFRPSSPAIAWSGFPQANPRAVHPMHLPATAAPGIPPASMSVHFPHSNTFDNVNSFDNPNAYYYSDTDFPQQQPQWNLDLGGGMPPKARKRKAESQENERLSKRLSLLNLEQNGQKLYVPVESPHLRPTESTSLKRIPDNDTMQLDDSKHKVYIYNLDDELSEAESDNDGRLVFLPDIEKHLMQNRIPPSVLWNKEGECAGMEMVLYSEPSSLTVPKEHDSVRKAIIEARQRAREKAKEEHQQAASISHTTPTSSVPNAPGAPITLDGTAVGTPNGFTTLNGMFPSYDDDPDAMEVD